MQPVIHTLDMISQTAAYHCAKQARY